MKDAPMLQRMGEDIARLSAENERLRTALREIAEASGFDNIRGWARDKAREVLENAMVSGPASAGSCRRCRAMAQCIIDGNDCVMAEHPDREPCTSLNCDYMHKLSPNAGLGFMPCGYTTVAIGNGRKVHFARKSAAERQHGSALCNRGGALTRAPVICDSDLCATCADIATINIRDGRMTPNAMFSGASTEVEK